MSLDADLIVDRRRMRRKLTFWRVIAIGVIVLAVAGAAALGSNRAGFTGVRPYIARVTIEGLIRGDRPARPLVTSARRHRPCRQPRWHHRGLRAAIRLAVAAA
jgi:protease IV